MIRIKTAPTEEQILTLCSVEQVKANQRISNIREDDLLRDIILDAYDYLAGAQGWLRRPVIDTVYEISLPYFTRAMEIPIAGAKTVAGVTYWNGETPSVSGPVAGGNYEVTVEGLYAAIRFFPSYAFPALDSARYRPITVEFVAGLGDPATVPRQVRRAMILLASHWYQNREATTLDARVSLISKKIEYGVEDLLGFLRAPLRMG